MNDYKVQPYHMQALACIFFSVLLFFSTVQCGFGAPSTVRELAEKQAVADAARAKLDELAIELETAGEELAEIETQQAITEEEIKKTQVEITAAEKELRRAKNVLAVRLSETYRMGPIDYLDVLLSSSSFREFTSTLYFIDKINSSDSAVIDAVVSAKELLITKRNELEAKKVQQTQLAAQAAEKAKTVEDSLSSQQALIDSLDAEIADLLERKRAEEEAAALAAAEAAAREAAARNALNNPPSSGSDNPQDGGSTDEPDTPTSGCYRSFDGNLGSSHPEVVAIAMNYLGCDYVWGATGYYSSTYGCQVFDCSGLTQYCYDRLGIDIPRVSRSQFWDQSGYIPPNRNDLLEPGDLVFFGTDCNQDQIHHVGIYIGNGQFIHAPQTGDVVKISSLWARSDYVGAIRV